VSDRYRTVADGFTQRVRLVSDWGAATPCEGWTASDLVGHLVGWVPGFLQSVADVSLVCDVDVSTDPVGAWVQLDHQVTRLLADSPDRVVTGPMGETTLAGLVDQFVTTDIAVHTWDLARSNGLDDRIDGLDPDALLAGAEQMDAALRASGHYGPWIVVPDHADAQDRLLGFFGRDPAWSRVA
jgi:uncharacterized protein (TIGR03086 family)